MALYVLFGFIGMYIFSMVWERYLLTGITFENGVLFVLVLLDCFISCIAFFGAMRSARERVAEPERLRFEYYKTQA